MEDQRLREVVQDLLDEPTPERVKQRLLKALRPSRGNKLIGQGELTGRWEAGTRRHKKILRRARVAEYDPYPFDFPTPMIC